MSAASSQNDRANDYLTEIVQINREHIIALAKEWLQRGFRTYAVWGKEPLLYWPISAWDEIKKLKDTDITLSAPITQGERVVGRTVLTGGAKTHLLQCLLDSEVNLVSGYLSMRSNSEQAARELVAQAQFKAEVDVVARIQQQLIPETLPQVQGLDMYAHSRPAQQVGGDFYDFFFSQNRLISVVGDISGKGLPAALFMVMARIALRTAAHTLSTSDPKDILLCANENLYDDLTEVGQFATVFVGSYDPMKRQLTYTNAAHSPIIYYPKGGRPIFLEADVIPLGVSQTSAGLNRFLPFREGDLLIIGTDGFNKCLNVQGEMLGHERLLQAVEALAHLPARLLATRLFETITSFAKGTSQSDDQTLVVMKGTVA